MLGEALIIMFTILLPLWLIFFFLEVRKYGLKIFHRYDEDIIGGAFTGLDKKSRIFESTPSIPEISGERSISSPSSMPQTSQEAARNRRSSHSTADAATR